MKPPLPRTQSAVPHLPHVQLEIAKAIRILMVPNQDEQFDRQAKIGATASQSDWIAEIISDALRILRKSGFNPDEPRVPAGSSKGGQWTTSSDDDSSSETRSIFETPNDPWNAGPEYAASNSPGMGHNQGPPLDAPPPIPPRPPSSGSALNAFVKAAAYWLAAVTGGMAARYIRILQGVYWIPTQALPYIRAYLSPPKTLKELQQDVQNPETGYEIHHIVEQAPARDERFPESMIEGPDNLVRISTLKHRQISAWFQTKNDDFDGLSPRNYLRGKSWQGTSPRWD